MECDAPLATETSAVATSVTVSTGTDENRSSSLRNLPPLSKVSTELLPMSSRSPFDQIAPVCTASVSGAANSATQGTETLN